MSVCQALDPEKLFGLFGTCRLGEDKDLSSRGSSSISPRFSVLV